jgi:hypothetical protein
MSAVKGNVIEFYRGDSYGPTQYTYNSGGTPVDISNYTVKFMLKARISDADADALIEKSCPITNGALGTFSLTLTPAETEALTPGIGYVYDIQLTNSAGTHRMTISNTCNVKADVRRGS